MRTPKSIGLKICGITKAEQARSIADLDVDAIGVIGVQHSKRFVTENDRRALFADLTDYAPKVQRVLVVANMKDSEISNALSGVGIPSVIQLHGEESLERCAYLRKKHPKTKLWKAIRIRSTEDIELASYFADQVDALLLDSWSPKQLGGTGQRIPLELLKQASIDIPWWIAGGISAEWIPKVFSKIKPSGVDASSQLESSPGIKDLNQVKNLIDAIRKEETKIFKADVQANQKDFF